MVDASNPAYSSVAGVLFNKSQTTLLECPGGMAGSYTVPASVTSIGTQAFYDCASLTNVIIGNNVTCIGEDAFYDCSGLTGVTMPGGVTSIGDDAFYYCVGLAGVTLPNSITSIGNSAFEVCAGLTNITIGSGVASIGYDAFLACPSLTGVYFQGNSPIPTNDLSVFSGDTGTVYYLPGTTGWGASFDGLPTALWLLPYPLILNNEPGFGVQPGGFSFTISWATNTSVVVEACTNLGNPVWQPVQTIPLSGGSAYFSDPAWANYSDRFYRVASQ